MEVTVTRHFFSIPEVAEIIGVEIWRVQRLFTLGLLPQPEKFAGRRMISGSSLVAIIDALRAKGWLRSPPPDGDAIPPEARANGEVVGFFVTTKRNDPDKLCGRVEVEARIKEPSNGSIRHGRQQQRVD